MDWEIVLGEENEPYNHQWQTAAKLLAGDSVVLRAPTGSGKTEAICGPFLHSLRHGGDLPDRLIYSLPMRVLATSLRDRAVQWNSERRIACQHGGDPGSALFEATVVFSTIDQTIGSFLCCPPTLPRKLGNIAAGSVLSGMLAFDEIQLFDPRRALQALWVLLDHQKQLGVPFAIASATLPDVLAAQLTEDFGAPAPLSVDEEQISSRRTRKIAVRRERDRVGLPVDEIVEEAEKTGGPIGVICNTVGRAQDAYLQLGEHPASPRVLLLHSRFLRQRRVQLEQRLRDLCGRSSEADGGYNDSKVIVVATQVIEAGLDISFRALFTELCPIDSLVQRAGRVCRGGGQGTIHVFRPQGEKPWIPYCEELVASTDEHVEDMRLDWQTEQRLVNEVVGGYLEPFLAGRNQRVIRQVMAEAQYDQNRRVARSAIRAGDNVRIAAHSTPEKIRTELRSLECVSLPVSTLRALVGSGAIASLRALDTSWDEREDRVEPRVGLRPIRDPGELVPNATYVCSPEELGHDADLGLVIGQQGRDFPLQAATSRPELSPSRRRETWLTHAVRTGVTLRQHFIESETTLWEAVANWWDVYVEYLIHLVLSMTALHDLGKLNRRWQDRVGAEAGEPLAHLGTQRVIPGLPGHAPLSAWLLMYEPRADTALHTVLRLAVQHHHSVGAQQTPEEGYELADGWMELATAALRRLELPPMDLSAAPGVCAAAMRCKPSMPRFSVSKAHVTYNLYARALRLSDWIATSGGDKNAVLAYEDWFRNA